MQFCKKELLGDTADEKEMAQIVSKVKEACGVKAYDTLDIVVKCFADESFAFVDSTQQGILLCDTTNLLSTHLNFSNGYIVLNSSWLLQNHLN